MHRLSLQTTPVISLRLLSNLSRHLVLFRRGDVKVKHAFSSQSIRLNDVRSVSRQGLDAPLFRSTPEPKPVEESEEHCHKNG
jgi:hypothetical protein